MLLGDRDERPHAPAGGGDWAETWGFELGGGTCTGFVRFTRLPAGRVCWCWVALRAPDVGLVIVRDDEVPPPRRDGSLEVRGDGLWLELVCETPFEHWGIGLEAFGLRVDTPADEVGERLPVGLDLEWETDGTAVDEHGPSSYEQGGVLHGDVLVGDDRIAHEGPSRKDHAWGAIELPKWPR